MKDKEYSLYKCTRSHPSKLGYTYLTFSFCFNLIIHYLFCAPCVNSDRIIIMDWNSLSIIIMDENGPIKSSG